MLTVLFLFNLMISICRVNTKIKEWKNKDEFRSHHIHTLLLIVFQFEIDHFEYKQQKRNRHNKHITREGHRDMMSSVV